MAVSLSFLRTRRGICLLIVHVVALHFLLQRLLFRRSKFSDAITDDVVEPDDPLPFDDELLVGEFLDEATFDWLRFLEIAPPTVSPECETRFDFDNFEAGGSKAMTDIELYNSAVNEFFGHSSQANSVENARKNQEDVDLDPRLYWSQFSIDPYPYVEFFEDNLRQFVPEIEEKCVVNPMYQIFDQLMVYVMIRHFKPKRIVEIGAGVSTLYATYARIQNVEEGFPCDHVVVEPSTKIRLEEIPNRDDHPRVLAKRLEEIEFEEVFASLEEGDVVFIDSSHQLAPLNDVFILYTRILPGLPKGVVLHIHDILFPESTFRYVYGASGGRLYLEQALLGALMSGNDFFRLVFPSYFLRHVDGSDIPENKLGELFADREESWHHASSFWLEVTREW